MRFDFEKYKTPTGTRLQCKGWIQEAALRMLLNNLDPEVAEVNRRYCICGRVGCPGPVRGWPEDRVVY